LRVQLDLQYNVIGLQPTQSRTGVSTMTANQNEHRVSPLIVISSVFREPVYVHQTLASLFMSDPSVHKSHVHLMVGGPDADYLRDYAHHPNLTVHRWTDSDAKTADGWWVHRLAAYNYWRCLTVDGSGHSGLCVCEDDVVFRAGFATKLAATIREIEEQHSQSKYVLAAYAPYSFNSHNQDSSGRRFCRYPANDFYGSQCVYYPASVLAELAAYLYDGAVERAVAPYDIVIKEFCRQTDCLLACTPSLTQHIGRVTTGLGNFHTSPTFEQEWGPAAD
jgi:hypothetical protein